MPSPPSPPCSSSFLSCPYLSKLFCSDLSFEGEIGVSFSWHQGRELLPDSSLGGGQKWGLQEGPQPWVM